MTTQQLLISVRIKIITSFLTLMSRTTREGWHFRTRARIQTRVG